MLGVVHGILLWADMDAATPPGSRGGSALCAGETARAFGKQLLSAIQYVHASGIVHNDIKCENCIIDSEGYLRLIDFGLSAYAVNRGDELVEYFGTRGYVILPTPYCAMGGKSRRCVLGRRYAGTA